MDKNTYTIYTTTGWAQFFFYQNIQNIVFFTCRLYNFCLNITFFWNVFQRKLYINFSYIINLKLIFVNIMLTFNFFSFFVFFYYFIKHTIIFLLQHPYNLVKWERRPYRGDGEKGKTCWRIQYNNVKVILKMYFLSHQYIM